MNKRKYKKKLKERVKKFMEDNQTPFLSNGEVQVGIYYNGIMDDYIGCRNGDQLYDYIRYYNRGRYQIKLPHTGLYSVVDGIVYTPQADIIYRNDIISLVNHVPTGECIII